MHLLDRAAVDGGQCCDHGSELRLVEGGGSDVLARHEPDWVAVSDEVAPCGLPKSQLCRLLPMRNDGPLQSERERRIKFRFVSHRSDLRTRRR